MDSINRRSFLAGSAAGSLAALTSGLSAAAGRAAKAAASERIQVGFVGARGRAAFLLSAFSGMKDVDVVAIADVDSRNLPAGVEAVEKLQGRRPQTVGDFRRLVDDPKIDVLVVG